MEHRDNRVLIQVMSKVEVERVIIKENEARFKLAYSSLTLRDDMCVDLGLSGDGPLTRESLSSQSNMKNHQMHKKYLTFLETLNMTEHCLQFQWSNR